jgi:4-hydroxybenzoyl-CoA reductase subunit alpha
VDSRAKATGQARFSADLSFPRMLVGKVLRSPYPHARILNIDVTRAKALPGVKAVITGQDTHGEKWGVFPYTRDMQMLQTEKVRYVGDEVAAVAAVDEDTALEALGLIRVDYDILPAVFTIDEALADDAPLVHEDHPRNRNVEVNIDVGEVDVALLGAYLVRTDTFTAPEDDYFMAEPYAVCARPDADGNIEVWCPNAGPHMKAKPLANVLKLPMSRVRVRKIAIGGAFGGRSEISPADFLCSLLALKTGRPVKIVYTREENTITVRQGHGMVVTHTTGMDREGRVAARSSTAHLDGGAYSSTGPIAVSVPFLCMEQTYRLENVRFHGVRVYTNKPVRGMIRIHGRAYACGVDMQLDMMAADLGLDPVDVRLKNARRPGETTATKSLVGSCGLVECIEKVVEKSGFREKYGRLPKWRGIGLGLNSVQTGFPLGIRGGSQAMIKFNEDGGVSVISGVVDNGQGNDQMIVQIAAEVLGVPPNEVDLITADTEVTANDPGSYSMVSTFAGGNAVRLAAEDARRQLFEVAADQLEANPADLVARDRKIFVKGSPQRGLALAKVVRLALIQGRPVMGQGSYSPRVDHGREWVSNPEGQLSEAFSFGATAAEVEVDPETGQVKVLNVVAAQDCGYALNPMVVEGQFEGSVAMGGQGGMLTEFHAWAGGHCLNPTQLDYQVPLAVDMPPITPIIVETIDPNGPYGAKEAGMSVAMSAAQAYACAVANAIGHYIKDFPLTPDKIVEAIRTRAPRAPREFGSGNLFDHVKK